MVGGLRHVAQALDELAELTEMAAAEDDGAALDDIADELATVAERLATVEFRRMFQGEQDGADAFLEIQAGSGGTEAQDWAEMLLRMYLRWGEKRGFATEIIELSPGEVAGLKSAAVQFGGGPRLRLAAHGDRRASPGAQVAVRLGQSSPHVLRLGVSFRRP